MISPRSVSPTFHGSADLADRITRAQEALANAEENLCAATEGASNGWYVRDQLGNGFWSPQVFNVFNLRVATEAPPPSIAFACLDRRERARLLTSVDRSFQKQVDCAQEYRLQFSNGVVKHARSRGR